MVRSESETRTVNVRTAERGVATLEAMPGPSQSEFDRFDAQLDRSRQLASSLPGMSEQAAAEAIEAAGRRVRILKRDSKTFPQTLDLRSKRISVWVQDGTVIRAEAG